MSDRYDRLAEYIASQEADYDEYTRELERDYEIEKELNRLAKGIDDE